MLGDDSCAANSMRWTRQHTNYKIHGRTHAHTQQILVSQVLLNKSGVGNSGIAYSCCSVPMTMNDANGENTLDISI